MREFKGTKGEWKYKINNARIQFAKPNMDLWFKDEDNNFKESPSQVLANAKLIAAAPELLQAVQYLLNAKDDGRWDKAASETFALNALNKALGDEKTI